MHRPLSQWLALFVSLALTTFSTFAAVRELAPFIQSSGPIEDKFDALASGDLKPGLSFYSKKSVLDDCNFSLNSVSILMIDVAVSAKIRASCEAVAASITEEAPTFSYAWYVKALAGGAAGQTQAFEHALLQSRRTAPNQEDLGYYRAVLAYHNWRDLSAEAHQELAADLILTAHSDRGRLWLAQRYVQDADFQQVIVKAMETAPPVIQRSFLRTIASIGRQDTRP